MGSGSFSFVALNLKDVRPFCSVAVYFPFEQETPGSIPDYVAGFSLMSNYTMYLRTGCLCVFQCSLSVFCPVYL